MAQIEIKCVMDSEFCKGNTWYQIRDMSDHVVYVYLDKHEFVGLPKCHFDMEHIRAIYKEQKVQKVIHDSDCSLHNEPAYPNGDCDCSVSIQEINKENILATLKHNGVNSWSTISDFNIKFDHLDVEFKNPNCLQIIEAHIGKKLEPLPKANPFDVVKVGQWIKFINNQSVGGDLATQNKWYEITQKSGNGISYYSNKGRYAYSNYPLNWGLTDIRDYNPTECVLKIGDEIHFYNDLKYSITEINHIESKFYLGESKSITFYFGENHKIKSVNGKKYDTIIIPKFDFAQCLVDAGFKRDEHGLFVGQSLDSALVWINDVGRSLNGGRDIEPTPENAKIIVSMANLAKGIK